MIFLFSCSPREDKHKPEPKYLEFDKIVFCETCNCLLFKDMAIKKQQIIQITSFFNVLPHDPVNPTKGSGEYQIVTHYYCNIHGKDIKFKCPD